MSYYVYFLQHPEDKYIKIGCTIHLQWRLWQLTSDYGVGLKLLGVIDGDKDTERQLHRQFKQEWRFGEWHRPSDRLLAYIAEHARQIDVTPAPKPTPTKGRNGEPRFRVGIPSDDARDIRHGVLQNRVRQILIQRYGSERSINRSAISRESGINPSVVGAWVRGHQEYAYKSTIQKWADYLGCTAEDIIGFVQAATE